jgi:hypothetical protein
MIFVESSGDCAKVFLASTKLSSRLVGSKQKKGELFILTSFLKSLASGSGVWLLLGLVFITLEMASTEWSRMSEERERDDYSRY